ncbi:polypeptide N-acetylgalactosaminyltransferase 5-like isoform X1, partial [Leptotrombidium deliense]
LLFFRSATPNGGIFAIDKQFFNYFEKFDDGLSFYGSDPIELGLAAWTCGGSIEIIPCSRVAHVFRDSIPYSFPGVQRTISLFNSARILETWMDDYRMFYYILFPDAVRKDRGNTTHRRELREILKCHPFTWYLENVFTDSTFPLHYKYFGQIENTHTKYCLDTVHTLTSGTNEARMRFCAWDRGGGTADTFMQMFVYTNKDEILTDGLCLDLSNEKSVLLQPCNGLRSQKWKFIK